MSAAAQRSSGRPRCAPGSPSPRPPAAAAVVAVFTILTSIVLANNDVAQLDRRLDAIVDASMYPGISDPRRGVLTTGRSRSTGQVVFQRGFQLPRAAAGHPDRHRQRRRLPGAHDPGRPAGRGADVDRHPRRQHPAQPARIPLYSTSAWWTVLIAGGLGWLLAGPAIRPLRKLDRAHQAARPRAPTRCQRCAACGKPRTSPRRWAGCCSRLAAAQRATTNSLQAAQDFAANAAHELRTPLTAMRADLDTLRIHDLPEEERDEVVADLARAQRRVEATITALGQLASGQLAQAEDREVIDVDRPARPGGAGEHAGRRARRDRGARPTSLGTVLGWPGGLRLAVDNLVRNAITHGGATRIVLAAHRDGDVMTIVVDDNGRGLPAEEHETVLGRFARGSNAAPGRLGARAGAGGPAGGAARRQHRAVRRPARRSAGHPDGVDRRAVGNSRRSSAGSASSRRPRQPSSSTAVVNDATTMKLTAAP